MRQTTPPRAGESGRHAGGALAAVSGLPPGRPGDDSAVRTLSARRARAPVRPPPSAAPALTGRAARLASPSCARRVLRQGYP